MGATASPPPAPAAEIQAVLDAELAYLHYHRHEGQPDPAVVRRSLIGLALSGGGIRSATTNLGILQALASMRILPMVDYLSTVSGGGYIGACFSTLLSWNNNAVLTASDPRAAFTFAEQEPPAFSTEPDGFPFRADQGKHARDESPRVTGTPTPETGGEPEQVHPRAGNDILAHLRTHGNFLIAHRGLFRRDALRGIGALTIGALYNALGFLLTLFAASAIYLAAVLGIAPDLPDVLGWPRPTSAADTSRPALISADSAILRTRQTADACPPGDPACVTATETTLRPPSVVDAIGRNARTVGVVFASTWQEWTKVGGGVWGRIRRIPAPLGPIVLALLLGALAAIGVLVWMRSRLDDYLRGRIPTPTLAPGDSVEEVFERRVLRRCAGTVAAATAIGLIASVLLWWPDIKGPAQVVWLFVPFATLASAVVVAFFALAVFLPRGAGWTRRSRSINSAFYAIVSWGVYIMLAIAIAPLAIFAMRDHPLGVGIGAIGSLLATRLLAARAPGSGKRFTLSPGLLRIVLGIAVCLLIVFGTLFFAALVARYADSWVGPTIVGAGGLALLVVLGLFVDHNKLGPQFFYRDRLAETYLFSELPDAHGRLRVFRDAMEMPLDALHGEAREARDAKSKWRNTAPYHLISAAINLAGSRDLTRKDRKSGYWLFSKLYCGSTHTGFRPTASYRGGRTKVATAVSISGAAASSAIGRDTFFAQAFATVLFNIRLGSWLENPAHDASLSRAERGIFWPWYLIREVGMNTTESARLVNLSDGGHTGDNIGIYPLLQRRCKVIIACDAERDLRLSFGSFTEALRHAYIDMGIDVDIDLTMIRPDPATGLSRSHCAVGRIHYPDRPDQESFLVYLKNSVVGDEPEPVLNYRVTCPDFPHESTADQFFDDAQFESYRALGHHIAENTFGPWLRDAEFDNARDHYAPTVRANV